MRQHCVRTLPCHTHPLNFLCVWVFCCLYIHTPLVCLLLRGAREGIGSSGTELQTVVNCHLVLEIKPWSLARAPGAHLLSCFRPHSHTSGTQNRCSCGLLTNHAKLMLARSTWQNAHMHAAVRPSVFVVFGRGAHLLFWCIFLCFKSSILPYDFIICELVCFPSVTV